MPREFHSITVEALVLKHADWGEADRILTLYTRQQGKIRALGKSVRKIRSRRAGHLEPFTHVTLQLAKSRDLPIITQAETINAFASLRESLNAIGHASYVIELLDKFTYEEGENISLFNLLIHTFERLTAPTFDPQLVLRYYEMRLLDYTGFRPELTHCVSCGAEIQPEDQYFAPGAGGVLCPRCGQETDARGAIPISKDALKYLRHLQRSQFTEAMRAHPSPEHAREMERILQGFLSYVLERGLTVPKFIREVNRPLEIESADPPDTP
ncbi:MAG: DNA repair protein RecO [Anaerolineales bacterium]